MVLPTVFIENKVLESNTLILFTDYLI